MSKAKDQPVDAAAEHVSETSGDVENLARRRTDVERAAQFMVQTFGTEALSRAAQVEATTSHPYFASSVTRAVAKLLLEQEARAN